VITYQLICFDGHEFEGWFKNSTAYEEQAQAGHISCPVCGDFRVEKGIMAPAVKGSVTKAKGRDTVGPAEPPPQAAPKVQQYFSGLRKFIEENSEYVGRKFPEEARKIHYGESEQRHIHGESTIAEAKDLIEEGIDVAPMPPDPTELN
jgi:hypothetical protein